MTQVAAQVPMWQHRLPAKTRPSDGGGGEHVEEKTQDAQPGKAAEANTIMASSRPRGKMTT